MRERRFDAAGFDSSGAHDPLDDAVARYLDRLNAGEKLDRFHVLAEHPDRGPEILERLEAYVDLAARAEPQPAGVLGDYRLVREIGRGGMGVVYEAWQGSLDRPVALKVLPAGIAADDRAFHRFLHEAKTAAKLRHPNVVGVYGMGVEQNTPFFSMELVEGETLAQVLSRLKAAAGREEERTTALRALSSLLGKAGGAAHGGEIDVEAPAPGRKSPLEPGDLDLEHYARLAKAFAGAADGLQHAHSQGVIHRDLKPSNLILDSEGRLRILDFGLARLEGQASLTASGDLLGTVLYMSPEQALARRIPIDKRTDIYSLGATLYEVLTWRPPFQGSDSRDTLSRIIFQDPVAPSRLNESIPRDLETIVLKCLRKDPADRYGTAEALAQDLRRFVRGDAIEARPQGRLERLVRRLARQKLRLLAAAGAAVLLIACAALAWRLAVETAKQRSREYERTVVAAAMKLLRGETVFSGHRGSAAEGGSFLPAEYREVLDERGRAAVGEALADLDRAAASLPERFEAHYHRARALLLLGRGAEAVRELEEALARRPGFAPALVLKAEALGGGDQQPALAGGARGEAWSRARHAMKRWRFEEAAAAYGELIALEEAEGELYPGSGIAHLLARGAARIHAGDHEGAISDFWQARALSRASWGELLEPHLLLGMAYFLRGSAGDLERAEERLREAASLCASGEEGDLWAAAVYSSLVGWCKHLGRLPDAVEAARKAVRLQPGDLRPRLALGWALLGALWVEQQGEGGARGSEGDEEAWSRELLEVAAGALELDHTSAAAHHLMGKALEARGEREKARSFFERAQERQESEVLQGRSDRNQGRSDMKNAKGRAAVVAASLVVALSGAGGAQEGTFEDVRLVESPVNSPFGDLLPCLSDDGLEMYFGSWRPGGKGRTDLYVAWRLARDEPWGAVRALEELNTPDSERGPSSADGLTLYFESNGLGGAGGRDIFVARRGARWDKEGNSVPFGPPENLVELNSSSIDGYPDISQDGLELFFTSDRPGGRGGWDLYVATWVPTEGRFGEPAALVNVNSGGLQLDPSISCDGLTLFFGRPSTTTSPGLGEVLVASRRSHDAEFGTPEPLGLPVNAGDLYWGGIPDISCDWPADGALLYFVRFVGIPQIYQATWRAWPAAFTASPETGEDPLHVSFDASRSRAAEGASIASYLWTFGDGESGAGVAVEHTYALPGKHSAVLVVTDDAGRSQRAERAIDVRFRPGSAEPWTSSDIGSPAASGAARMEDGCLTSFSGGIGFQGRSDEGHLAYQEVSGDVVLAANVRGLWSEGTGGQSGVILRASAEADSPFAAVLVEQAGTRRTFRLRYREAAGASARSVTGADVELPGAWVRISRRGGTVVGESSSDGTSWSELGRVALDLPPALVAGVATAARSSTGVRCAARVCGITLEAKPALAFRRGEANQDGKVDISDAVSILQWLFLGEAEPGCLSAADVDGDKAVNITDPIYLLTHLFLGGPSPPEPFATCGPDPSPDGLPCESLGPCP